MQEVYTMVELRLSLLTAGNGQRVSTYQKLVNVKGQVRFGNFGMPVVKDCLSSASAAALLRR